MSTIAAIEIALAKWAAPYQRRSRYWNRLSLDGSRLNWSRRGWSRLSWSRLSWSQLKTGSGDGEMGASCDRPPMLQEQ